METDVPQQDDMYNYQCNFLEHGLLYMNFIDSISEGDEDRILLCWKFLLLHFYADKGYFRGFVLAFSATSLVDSTASLQTEMEQRCQQPGT